MSVRFEAYRANEGFDDSATPNWIIVPLKGENKVWLIGEEELTVTSTAPGVASVEIEYVDPLIKRANENLLRISGNAPGRAYIEARKGKTLLGKLEVSVKSPVALDVSFHFVSDSAKPVNHTTNRKPEELAEMVSILNSIYIPQTNVSFKLKNYFLLKFNRDMGDAVNYNIDYRTGKPMKGHEWEMVVAKRDRSAHINVFFVWKNEFVSRTDKGIEKSEALGYIIGDGRDCLVQDWDGYLDRDNDGTPENSPAWENARMLAHEIGHVLGIYDITKTRRVRIPQSRQSIRVSVNDHYVLGSGPFIPKKHSNIMHSIARQIAGK